MKRFENILIKLVVVQFIFLILAQLLLMNSSISPYLTRMIDYEGVAKHNYTKILEVFEQK